MKIQLDLSDADYKLLLDTIKFHEDNLKHKLNWINNEIEYINNDNYDKEKEKRQIKYCEDLLENIKDCNNLFKKIKASNNINSFEITKNEYNELLYYLVEQIYHANARIEDFSGDRFGWGKDNCSMLITQEKSYINILMNVFDKYRGKHTYESILNKIS